MLGVDAPAADGLHQRVVAQVLVVVEVLVAQGDAEDSLGQHVPLLVGDPRRVAWVGDDGVEPVDQSQVPVHLAQQQRTCVTGNAAAVEVGDDLPAADTGKDDGFEVTVCHSDGLAPCGVVSVISHTSTGSKAVAL